MHVTLPLHGYPLWCCSDFSLADGHCFKSLLVGKTNTLNYYQAVNNTAEIQVGVVSALPAEGEVCPRTCSRAAPGLPVWSMLLCLPCTSSLPVGMLGVETCV